MDHEVWWDVVGSAVLRQSRVYAYDGMQSDEGLVLNSST